MTNSGPRPTRNEKRDHAREQARVFREKQQKQQKRRRIFVQGGVTLAVLAVAVIVVLVIVNANAAQNLVRAKETKAGPQNMISDGILFTGVGGKATPVKTAAIKPKGKPVPTDESKYPNTANIVEYIDLQCPYCDQFEATNASQIESWVAAGKATLEVHPISILDNPQIPTDYSSRAASAMGCVANYQPDEFLPVMVAMYKNQPEETTKGLPNSKIASIISGAGANNPKVASCVIGHSFKSWVASATARADVSQFKGGSMSTPTVVVNGQPYPATSDWLTNAAEFAAFVDQVKPGTTTG